MGVKVGFSTKANTAVIRDNLVASINEPLALIKALTVPYDWYSTEKIRVRTAGAPLTARKPSPIPVPAAGGFPCPVSEPCRRGIIV